MKERSARVLLILDMLGRNGPCNRVEWAETLWHSWREREREIKNYCVLSETASIWNSAVKAAAAPILLDRERNTKFQLPIVFLSSW